MTLTWQITLVATFLTLLVWLLFFFAGLPLDPGSTAVVALAFVGLTIAGRAILSRHQKDRSPPPSPANRS